MRMQSSIHLVMLFVLMVSLLATRVKAQRTEGINSELLKTIVSVEQITGTNTSDGTHQARSIGTGFLVGLPSAKTNAAGHAGFQIVLVTAKHVVTEANGTLKSHLAYRLNNRSANSDLVPELSMERYAGRWFFSTNHDVACRFIAIRDSDVKTFSLDMFLRQQSIQPGAPAFIIGFPLGLRSESYTVPIVRRASVAFVDQVGLMVDGFTFPGNSGGPVVYSSFLGNTVPIQRGGVISGDALIGLVSSSLNYTDVAVSQQTKRPRISFEENSGLTHVVPAEAIQSLLQRQDVTDFRKRFD